MIKKILLSLVLILFSKLSFANKIDSSGQYLPYPGITVVAKIRDNSKKMLETLFRSLAQNELLTQHFALLPPESYHMTTLNLFTEEWDGQGKWKSFVSTSLPWIRRLNLKIQANAIESQATLEESSVTGVIMLNLKMGSQQKEVLYRPAREFGLMNQVPRTFHITLGYLFKKISSKTLEQIKTVVNRAVVQTMVFYGDTIQFDSPKLSSFRDMTDFQPWDGEKNPF